MRSRLCLAVGVVVALAAAPAARPADTAPTFTKDVAPIVFATRVDCHRAGEIGLMPLTSFAEVRPWARAIRTAVVSKAMPPWLADADHERYANDPSLSAAEIDTIVKWVDSGAAEGNPADIPRLPALAQGWPMGTPDVGLLPGPRQVTPTGRSVYADLSVPTSFPADRYVSAAEIRIGGPGFTHHANLLLKDGRGSARVASYSPGAGAKSYPAGVAKLIPKGATLTLNMHYNPKGEPRTDLGSRIALQFAQGPVRQVAITDESGTNKIDIPPGDANYERIGEPFVFGQDSHILTLMPRMNERGTDFRYTLVLPDGTSRVLLNIPRWNYGWVLTYVLAQPVAAPKGSRLETIAHWDNSAGNKLNPDPTARVPFGPEIMNGYFEYVIDAQDLTRPTQN
jgi:hypothetical protein